MSVSNEIHNVHSGTGRGYTQFLGTYTSNDSFFFLSYDALLKPLSSYTTHSLTINVNDLTASSVLFSQTITTDTVGSYYIPNPIGDNISVDFKLSLNKTVNQPWLENLLVTSSVNYDMSTAAVAPEPISSILFITGGTLLAGRRYLRRKA